MQAIYEPKGRAREYAELACNLYRGCGHGCTYCYAPAALHMPRDEFHGNPQPRPGIPEALERDAKKLAGDPRPVLLCFTCDPYQPINDTHQLARRAIEILNGYGIATDILTKRPSAAMQDLDLLRQHAGNALAVTLTFWSDGTSPMYEPNADPPSLRIKALKIAHDKAGIGTWVSLEPVVDPSSALRLIDLTHRYVDLYKVGKWNHDARANAIDWPGFRERVIGKLEGYGKKYLIKKDLQDA